MHDGRQYAAAGVYSSFNYNIASTAHSGESTHLGDTADAVNALLDAPVDVLGDLLQRQALVNLLDGLLDRRRDPLDAALGVGDEVADVALPAGRPSRGLAGEALLGAGQDHVEGCESTDACDAEGQELGATWLGNADGHFDGWIDEGCCVGKSRWIMIDEADSWCC